jgi:hypothetical protein
MVTIKCTKCGCSGTARDSGWDPETGINEIDVESLKWDEDYEGDCQHEEFEIGEDIPEDYDDDQRS